MQKISVIFDLDGTLWDASEPVAKSWEATGKTFLGDTFKLDGEGARKLMGKTMDGIISEIAPNVQDRETRERFSRAFLEAEVEYLKTHPGRLWPHGLETLHALKAAGHRLFIVSNCQNGYIETFLPIVPADLFDGYLCWGDTHADKHVTITALMEKHGIERAVYVGDTEGDETQAHLAGLPFIHASYGYGKATCPEAVADSFADLPSIVARF